MSSFIRTLALALALGIGCGGWPQLAGASGSYVRSASHRAGLDDYPKYALGKSVSTGSVALPETPSDSAGEQEPVLDELQTQLPRSARARLDLPALAGRLTPDQLEALQYYLKVRYRIR